MLLSILGLLGGFAGTFALGWQLFDAFRAYLHIELTNETVGAGCGVKLRTIVENKKFFARKIDGAFLLIGPADEDPGKTARSVFKENNIALDFSNSTEMVRLITDHIRRDISHLWDKRGRAMIPLPYYFLENIDVADERLSFEQVISEPQLPEGVYSARFYIEATRHPVPRLHRLVHTAFAITKQA